MSKYGLCTICVKREEGCKSFKRWLELGQKVAICTDFIKIKTNGDKIRSMSDYDLAEFLCAIMNCCGNDACGTFCPMWKCCNDGPDNVEDWLKLPADKEETE